MKDLLNYEGDLSDSLHQPETEFVLGYRAAFQCGWLGLLDVRDFAYFPIMKHGITLFCFFIFLPIGQIQHTGTEPGGIRKH
jgi:hypothetical protein